MVGHSSQLALPGLAGGVTHRKAETLLQLGHQALLQGGLASPRGSTQHQGLRSLHLAFSEECFRKVWPAVTAPPGSRVTAADVSLGSHRRVGAPPDQVADQLWLQELWSLHWLIGASLPVDYHDHFLSEFSCRTESCFHPNQRLTTAEPYLGNCCWAARC